jgi:hypothetical protein
MGRATGIDSLQAVGRATGIDSQQAEGRFFLSSYPDLLLILISNEYRGEVT